jgi:hypothetical protein
LDAIYPIGTTAEEQQVMAPLILDGNNVQTALAVYRVLKQGAPSSLTQYGLTDSQSAEAYKAMRAYNLGAQRAAGTINDTTYFSMMDAMKNITSMAAMSFDTAAELRAYMKSNTKVILNPVYDANGLAKVDSAGKPITTSTSDGGVPAATNIIINQTIPKRADDTSALYSSKTTGNANVNIDTPPNTSTWGSTLMSKLPVLQTPMIPPTGRGIVVTPNMSDSDKAAALSSATSSITEPGFITPAKAVVDSAAGNSSNSLGFVSPNATRATGQSQWFMVTNGATSQAVAASQCAQYGAKLATLAQITDAYNAGASYQAWGWVADSPTSQGFPVRNASLNQSYSSTTVQNGNGPANCFGPKPPRGTPNVAAWTDTARTIGTEVYTAGDWSKRTGGDGGVSKSSNGTPDKPGTPLATAEVFFVKGSFSKVDAQGICSRIGGDLATLAQLQAAQAGGGQWCSAGWLKDVATPRWPMQVAVSGCGGPGVNESAGATTAGANCYAIKPSINEKIEAFVSSSPEASYFGFVKKIISQTTEGFQAANYTCPSGYTLNGTTCQPSLVAPTIEQPVCPPRSTAIGGGNCMQTSYMRTTISATVTWVGWTMTYTCPSGYDRDNTMCYLTCDSGYNTSGTFCSPQQPMVKGSCPAGTTSDGLSLCRSCPAGTNLNGIMCVTPNLLSIPATLAPPPPSVAPVMQQYDVAAFSTNTDPVAWSQSTYVDTNVCPAGSTSTTCVLNGVSQRTCLRNGETCSRPECPSGSYMHKDGRCVAN